MREIKKLKIGVFAFFLNLFFHRAKRTAEKVRTLASVEFESILVYSTTALGDYMFNSPALRAIRQRYPRARITLVAHPKYRKLLTRRDFYDDVLFWNNKVAGMFSLVKQAKQYQPQLAVLLHSHAPYDIASAAMAGCQYIVRDNYAKPIGRLADWLVFGLDFFDEHVIARKMKLVETLGATTDDTKMALPCHYETEPKQDGRIRVGFQLGASTLERCWPPEYYAALAQKLLATDDRIEIVLIGSEQEIPLADALMQNVDTTSAEKITSFVGKTTLPQLLGVIASMDLLVTGDTGPFHLAISLRVPTLSLFVTEDPRLSGPYQDRDRHDYIYLPLHDPKVTDKEKPLKAITVEEVYGHVINKLAV
ncbi:glycosyl transferase [Serratia sp. S1B]|nr:glycosyl transferase [Serratia sp. S1B]